MARTADNKAIRWRLWMNVALVCLALLAVMLASRRVRRFAVTDPRFTLPSPDERGAGLSTEGVTYASRARLMAAFAPDYGRSIFLIPIAERRRRLLAIDWVEDASIARIWPNRVAVRIEERKPVAFVNLLIPGARGARVLLIDAEGVLLDPPAQSHFTFPVLSGVSEEQTEAERRLRVQAMLRLLADLGSLGKDISEVNAAAPDNLMVVTQVDGQVVELVMGNQNFSRRIQSFLDHYPEIHRRSPALRAFDLRLEDRITAATRAQ